MRWHAIHPGNELRAYADDQGIPVGSVAIDELGRVWKWLKNAGSTSIAAAKCAKPTSFTAFTVEISTALNGLFAGVRALGADTLPQNYYGWFLVRGIGDFTFGDTATAVVAGNPIVTDDDSDKGNVGQAVIDVTSTVNESTVEAVTNALQNCFAYAHEAETVTDATFKAAIFRNCWGD